MSWLERHRVPVISLLIFLIVAGGAFFFYRQTLLPGGTEIIIVPPSPEIYVYIEGEVVNPGIYVLAEGDRIIDAIEAAGGFTSSADRGAVNLVASLNDGQQVYVYKAGDIPQKVNINTAESWLLQLLPGIGEVLAGRIIEYRNGNGGFRIIEDLKKVEGIGQATFDNLKDKITVR